MSSKEEITTLVEQIQDGERDMMPVLWEKVERLVAWQAKQIMMLLPPSAGVDFDDLYNSGYIALNNAVQRYERDIGEFISLFMLCLKSAFEEASGARSKRAKKDPLRQGSTESLDCTLPGFDDLTLEDTIADERNNFEEAEERIFHEQLHDEMERALNSIPEKESYIIRQRFYEGKTLTETGNSIGSNPEWARQLEHKGLQHLRAPKISRPLRQFVEDNTPFYMHIGPHTFNTTHTSSTEQIVLLRERLEKNYMSGRYQRDQGNSIINF